VVTVHIKRRIGSGMNSCFHSEVLYPQFYWKD
jgi:hypothetical protein